MTPEQLEKLEALVNRCLEPVLFEVLLALKIGSVPVVRVDVDAVKDRKLTRIAMQTRQQLQVIDEYLLPAFAEMVRSDGYTMLARWIEERKKDRVILHFGNAVYALEYTGAKFIPIPELTGGADKIVGVRKG